MLSGLENPLHLLIVLAVALLVFGPKRLPEMGKSLGSGLRNFKESISGEARDDEMPAPQPAVTQATAAEPQRSTEETPAAAPRA